MNLKHATLGFVTCFLVTLPAIAGTVGVFRVADGQIVEVSDDGTRILVEKEAFKKLKLKAKEGDTVILDGTSWMLSENEKNAFKLSPQASDLSIVELVPADE